MPTYDYKCSSCGHKGEVFQKMSESPLTICPICKGSSFQRGFGGGVGLHFQGTGFYHTDYGKGCSKSSCDCKEKS